MNAEDYYKDQEIDLDFMPQEDIDFLVSVIDILEKGKDRKYKLNIKDRGLTKDDMELFLKDIQKLYTKGSHPVVRRYLCLMGPVTYAKFKKAVYDRRSEYEKVETYF